MEKRPEMRIFALIIGLMTVVAIVVSQLFYFQDTAHAKLKKENKTEQQQEESDEAFISLPSPSLPTSSYVVLQIETFCLFDVSTDNEEDSEDKKEESASVIQLFQTLVGAVISPNAP